MKSRSFFKLIRLYLAYHFNKMTIIVFGFILFLWIIVLFLNSGFPIDMAKYAMEPKFYHTSYQEQSIFFLQLIDGVIVAFLVGAEISSLSLFDPMLVPNVSRIKIICSKLIANFIIIFGILGFQILTLELIGILLFPNYVTTLENLMILLYLSLPLLELLLLGEAVSMVFNTIFIPILIFVMHILFLLLMKVEEVSKILTIFIPKIQILSNRVCFIGNLSIFFGICALLILSIVLMFQKKDISSG